MSDIDYIRTVTELGEGVCPRKTKKTLLKLTAEQHNETPGSGTLKNLREERRTSVCGRKCHLITMLINQINTRVTKTKERRRRDRKGDALARFEHTTLLLG